MQLCAEAGFPGSSMCSCCGQGSVPWQTSPGVVVACWEQGSGQVAQGTPALLALLLWVAQGTDIVWGGAAPSQISGTRVAPDAELR